MLFTKTTPSDFPWKLLTVEALLVVSSVLLALALSSWYENRQQADLAQRAVQEFVDEASSNCQRIITFQDYHRAVAEGEQEPAGIRIGLLRNDAWDFAKTTGAAPHMDHDLVADIVEIAAHQGDHRALVQSYIAALFTTGLQRESFDDWHVAGERGVIRDLVLIQQQLLEKYRQLADRLESGKHRDDAAHSSCGFPPTEN